MGRELSDDEAEALGLPVQRKGRELSQEEATSLGLPVQAPPPAEVGMGETFLNNAAGALPLGKQIVNAGTAGLMKLLRPEPGAKLTPQAAAELGIDYDAQDDLPSLADEYRSARSRFDERTEAGSEQNPNIATAGKVTGVGLSIAAPFMPKVSVGAGAGGRIASSALTGSGYGALNSAANSRGDLMKGEVGQVLSDAVGVDALKKAKEHLDKGEWGKAALYLASAGGVGGLLTGGLLSGTGEVARKTGALDALAGVAKRVGIKQGRRVLTNGADSMSNRNALPDDVVEEALRSKGIKAFGTTEGARDRLSIKAGEVGEEYARIVASLEAKGVSGPDARKLADELFESAAKLEPLTMNNALPQEYLDSATKLLAKGGPSGKLGLSQTESLKRSLQDMAKYGKLEETPLNIVRRDVASRVRQANEDAIEAAAKAAPADAELGELAAKFVPVKQRTGRLIQASEAAERGAARGEQRNAISLTDKMMATAGLATGNPAALIAAGANNFARNRGTSAVAKYGLDLSDLLSTPSAAGAPGRAAAVLSDAAAPHPSMSRAAMAEREEDSRRRAQALVKLLDNDPKAVAAVEKWLQGQDAPP